MHLHSLPLFKKIREKLLRLLEELAVIHVYTNITQPGSGAPLNVGLQTIRIEFGTTVANIDFCLQIFKAPDYDMPIKTVKVGMNTTTFEFQLDVVANSSYMFKIVPCEPGDMIVTAGSIGMTSAIIE